MFNKGMLIIISGPSGAGKGTVVNELIKDENYALSISVTTRKPREGEEDGVHYFFKTYEEAEKMIANNELLEYAKFCGEYYATPLFYVLNQLEKGKNVILEIEVQGALQVKEKYPDAVSVFLAPPNIDELEKRLRNRATETEEKIVSRIERAKEEILLLNKYDYIVMNSVVSDAVCDINNIIECEKKSAKRNSQFIEKFLKGDDCKC